MNYINSALNFTGSKFNLLSQIIPEMDFTKKYFVDLFAGSGVVGFNVVDKYDKILTNDIIKDLIGIHKELINNPLEFIEKVKSLVVSKEDQDGFNKLRENYNKNNSAEGLYALLLCSTNNLIRFNKSGFYNQTFGKRSFNSSTEKKLNEFIKHITPYKNKILFSSKHFTDIKMLKPSMIYCDPPYGYCVENEIITNKQVSEAGYNVVWSQEDDIKLYNYLLDLNKNKHSFMLSGVFEHDNKRSWLINRMINDKFNYKELNFNYNKVSKKGNKKTIEVIVTNY
jgi:DNA adenine methylase Dam